MDFDAPKVLLQAVLRLLKGDSREEWVCWQHEPGAAIMQLAITDHKFKISVYNSPRESHELEVSGKLLKEHCDKCEWAIDVEIPTFVDDLVTEFSLYENGNGRRLYENHWKQFPQQEYIRLKEAVSAQQEKTGKKDDLLCFTY